MFEEFQDKGVRLLWKIHSGSDGSFAVAMWYDNGHYVVEDRSTTSFDDFQQALCFYMIRANTTSLIDIS